MIHGLDTQDLSPTTRPPRNRPPSASEWPAMSLPTRVATPTTDTAEDTDDSDLDTPGGAAAMIQHHSPPAPTTTTTAEPTFKPIAAVRTTSPHSKPIVVVADLPTPAARRPTTTAPKTLPQPVPLKLNQRVSKSPPSGTIDPGQSSPPLEDAALHHQQKNTFADFFSKMKSPEDEKTSPDLPPPKTLKNDSNKVRLLY